MNPGFSWFEVIVLVGVVQGFVMAILIWIKQERNVSKWLLSWILVIFNLLCIRILILTTGLWQTSFLRYFPLPVELAIPPLLWLYTLSLVRPGFKPGRRHIIHFIPFGLSCIYSLVVYLFVFLRPLADKDQVANNLYFNGVKQVEDYLAIVSSVFYWITGLRLILTYRSWLYNNISSTSYPTYAWLRNVSLLVGILIAVFAADVVLDYFFNFGLNSFAHWKLFFIYLSALIYYLGFRGFQLHTDTVDATGAEAAAELDIQEKQHALLQDGVQITDNIIVPQDEHAPGEETGIEDPVTIPGEPAAAKLPKLTDEKITEIENAVKTALEIHELYLDPELSLNKLAKTIQLLPVQVSYVINRKFKKPFRNLVNEYRVARVKEKLADPTYKKYSILGIAYACGFNSEASFYRIFRSIAGMSPKEYLNSLDTTSAQLPEE